eukprot:gb/GECG01014335.1/.p1 GENE.gb/GECG01014335.1/~~gb/GECG01014335.1/.p1  ORF type:complete len:727 (+),score=67.75 gb/GECG01014335.1/:1-2181(+)
MASISPFTESLKAFPSDYIQRALSYHIPPSSRRWHCQETHNQQQSSAANGGSNSSQADNGSITDDTRGTSTVTSGSDTHACQGKAVHKEDKDLWRKNSGNNEENEDDPRETFFSSRSSCSVPQSHSPRGYESDVRGSDADERNSRASTPHRGGLASCEPVSNSSVQEIDYHSTKLSDKERKILLDKYCYSTGNETVEFPNPQLVVRGDDGQRIGLSSETICSTVSVTCIDCMPVAVLQTTRVASMNTNTSTPYTVENYFSELSSRNDVEAVDVEVHIDDTVLRSSLLPDGADIKFYSSYEQRAQLSITVKSVLPVAFDFPWMIFFLPRMDSRLCVSLCNSYGDVLSISYSVPSGKDHFLFADSRENRKLSSLLGNGMAGNLEATTLSGEMLVMIRTERIPQLVQQMVPWSLNENWLPTPFANFTPRPVELTLSETRSYTDVLRKAPNHIAIIMDGNGRWAEKKGISRSEGHKAGVDAVLRAIRFCRKLNIQNLTVYAFSSQNWQRPPSEVNFLMKLLLNFLQEECKELVDNGVKMVVNGRTDDLPFILRQQVAKVVAESANNREITVCLALSYGGREEIVDTARAIVEASQKGNLHAEDVNEKLFRSYMPNPELPDPDLLIRTSGELRLSNFLLWQLAYAEIYVTSMLWPDFAECDIMDALVEFSKRRRRFGKTQSQVDEDPASSALYTELSYERSRKHNNRISKGGLLSTILNILCGLCPSGRQH